MPLPFQCSPNAISPTWTVNVCGLFNPFGSFISKVDYDDYDAAISLNSCKNFASFETRKLFCNRIFLFKNTSSGTHRDSHWPQRKFVPSHFECNTSRFAPSVLRPRNSFITASSERCRGCIVPPLRLLAIVHILNSFVQILSYTLRWLLPIRR